MARHSRKITLYGYTFDSEGEGARALALMEYEREGVISNLILDKAQLTHTLQAGFIIAPIQALALTKRKMSAITYTPDFAYCYQGVTIYEDYKAYNRKSGRPLIEVGSRLRIKLFQAQLASLAHSIFRVCIHINAHPASDTGYFYSLNERS
jgi:hypothetical protein